ncbi:SRPBCC domain-containing protein [Rhodohalobacter sp. SW132]|uniref:SRPBCC domain-containing protein n=1 Tax=Rhodohalobacter sp. SW132 TaxID=2293433 RepID=UPI000E25759D|nr:SRPBCC domain-containing protein [Rhodohalobacter sp. SW132]REL32875.1 SRPBCC domain-containing protein [Rhodohalobacter sp. SW132]
MKETIKHQTVETKEREIIFTRVFNAPRKLVFETYSTCEHLINWWGPRSWPLSYCQIDFKPGGTWHYCMSGPNDGDESWGLAKFKKIDEPEKIIYQDYFSDKDGNINTEMPAFDTVITFDSVDSKTKITVISKVGSKEEVEKLVEMGMIEGFTETWDRLEEHLEDIQES